MSYKYDIAISFAGKDRAIAEKIARLLEEKKVRVFYDNFEKADLWGKDLFQHFQDIYQKSARYCLIIISKHYQERRWTQHELKQAQAREFDESGYILPLRIDDTEISGVLPTKGYIDYKGNEGEIAELIIQKLFRSLTVLQLFKFLEETNPQIVSMLSERQNRLPLLISSSRNYLIADLQKRQDLSEYVEITPTHNFIMNGVGIKGYILDRAGQPWESYIFNLKGEFLTSINA